MHENIPRQERAVALSVVTPVLHEPATINEHVAHVKMASARLDGVAIEIIVVDPEGDTLVALDEAHADVQAVHAPPGRAVQMNAGAYAASGDILLFLHVDTRLPEDGLRQVADTLEPAVVAARRGESAEGHPEAGAFSLAFAEADTLMRLFALGGNLRNRWTRTPYGDQAQFFTARLFRELGGYPEIPLMEDVAIMHALARSGRTPVILSSKVQTSCRRYREQGVLYAGIRNNILRTLYGMGVPAQTLARHYHRRRKRS